MRKMSLTYATTIALNNDYSFKSSTELKEFKLIDPCEVSLFSFDVTGQLKKQLTPVLTDLENDIDKQIGALDIKPELNELWELANKPIPIQDFGFLNINPQNISLNKLTFSGTKALLDVAISLQPSFTTTSITSSHTKLPNLSKINATDGFNIALDVYAGYDSLSGILTDQIKDDTILIKKNAFIIKDLQISGTINQEITLKINFDGKRKGTLFLKGKPTYDAISHEISFPDLDFDLSTKNLLLKTAKWLLNDKIVSTIREQAKYNIENEINGLRQKLQGEINKNNNDVFTLKADINDLDLSQIFLDEKNIILRLQTNGNVSVLVK
jgi:hypothetical protein